MIHSAAPRLLVLALPIAFLGCLAWFEPRGHIAGQLPKPTSAPADGASLAVGAARVDFTPAPGVPMNYSLDGKVSRGFWTRLYARAIYLEDKNGNAIALVSCSLPHVPNGLVDRVAELASKRTRIDHLGRAQIVVSATHTHHGPENFFSDEFYNAFPSPRQGFDPLLFDFIAERITQAIEAAFDAKQASASLRIRRAQLPRFFRNRSFGAFVRNHRAQDLLAENMPVPDDCALVPDHRGRTDKRACRAVRTWVEAVDFLSADGTTLASLVFLAAHPTVLSSTTEVFTGDLFEASATLLEQRRLAACGGFKSPVVALFNGAQGDASVTWQRRDRFELLNEDTAQGRLGLAVQLARWICGADPGIGATSRQEPATAAAVAWRFAWLPLGESLSALAAAACDPWNELCTNDEPLPGAPAMGGAQDGRTIWAELGVVEGLRSAARSERGRKAVGLKQGNSNVEIAKIVVGDKAPPGEVPLGVYRVGSLALVALPGEFTTMMGERIRQTVAAKSGATRESVFLIGLANGHVSYVTTPEEYDAQYYEGASNLYGAATGPLVETKLGELAALPASVGDPRDHFDYEPGVCRVFVPADAGEPGYLADDGLENLLQQPGSPDLAKRDFPTRCWMDAIPRLPADWNACVRAVPYVWIEKNAPASAASECSTLFESDFLAHPCERPHPDACDPAADPRACVGSVPQDNCGLEIVTVLHGSYADRTRWCAFWLPPEGIDPSDYHFCVAGVTGANVVQTGGFVDPATPPGLALDTDPGNGWSGLPRRHGDCCKHPLRPVCEYPTK